MIFVEDYLYTKTNLSPPNAKYSLVFISQAELAAVVICCVFTRSLSFHLPSGACLHLFPIIKRWNDKIIGVSISLERWCCRDVLKIGEIVRFQFSLFWEYADCGSDAAKLCASKMFDLFSCKLAAEWKINMKGKKITGFHQVTKFHILM